MANRGIQCIQGYTEVYDTRVKGRAASSAVPRTSTISPDGAYFKELLRECAEHANRFVEEGTYQDIPLKDN